MPPEQMQVDFTQAINELANRLRILESKQGLLSEKLLVMNQNMVEEYKKVMKEIKVIDLELKEAKKELANVKNIVRHLTEEAGKFAKQSDLKVLEKYIKLWSPMNFVTEEHVRKMIQAALIAEEAPKTKRLRKDDATNRDTSERDAGTPQ